MAHTITHKHTQAHTLERYTLLCLPFLPSPFLKPPPPLTLLLLLLLLRADAARDLALFRRTEPLLLLLPLLLLPCGLWCRERSLLPFALARAPDGRRWLPLLPAAAAAAAVDFDRLARFDCACPSSLPPPLAPSLPPSLSGKSKTLLPPLAALGAFERRVRSRVDRRTEREVVVVEDRTGVGVAVVVAGALLLLRLPLLWLPLLLIFAW